MVWFHICFPLRIITDEISTFSTTMIADLQLSITRTSQALLLSHREVPQAQGEGKLRQSSKIQMIHPCLVGENHGKPWKICTNKKNITKSIGHIVHIIHIYSTYNVHIRKHCKTHTIQRERDNTSNSSKRHANSRMSMDKLSKGSVLGRATWDSCRFILGCTLQDR